MKEKLIYNYIKKYHKKYGYMPTYREIQNGLGEDINSIATIHFYVTKLINDGKLITNHPGSPRAYRFPESEEKK